MAELTVGARPETAHNARPFLYGPEVDCRRRGAARQAVWARLGDGERFEREVAAPCFWGQGWEAADRRTFAK